MSGRARWPFADRVAAGAALLLALLLLLRVLRYLPVTLSEGADRVLGDALIVAWTLFIFPLLLAPWHLAAVALLLVAACLRPAWFFARESGAWHLQPGLHAFVWLECALNHAVFDLHPRLALVTLLAVVAVELHGRLARGSSARPLALAAAGLLGAFSLFAPTVAAALAGLALAAVVLGALLATRRLGLRERRLLVLLGGAAVQILAAGIPLAWPSHGGREIGRGLAYSFCESERADALYVAVPEAPTMLPWSLGRPHGIDGFVARYDLPGLDGEERLRFFSEAFHGRLEWLTCTRERVYVGMTNTTHRGETHQDHAMSFAVADPSDFEPDVMGGDVGHGIAHDPVREALYFVSENQTAIGRLDLGSGERERVMRDVPQQKSVLSLVVGPRSYHAGRDSLFITEWFGGTHAYEVDLETQSLRGLYAHRNGGALGITVDERYDRLYVVGIWGMEVFDIETGEVVGRVRLGSMSRSPVIDAKRGLLYVASTFEGTIRVFEHASLRQLGVIAIGYGPRIPYFSETADLLLASSARAYYAWEGDDLAARFGASP